MFTVGKVWQPKGRDRSRLELQIRASKVVMEDGLEQRRAFWEQGRQLVFYIFIIISLGKATSIVYLFHLMVLK